MAEYKLDPIYVIDTGLMYIAYYEQAPHRAVAVLLDPLKGSRSSVLKVLNPEITTFQHNGGRKIPYCTFSPYSGCRCVPLRFVFEADEPDLYSVLAALLDVQLRNSTVDVFRADVDTSDTMQVSTKGEDEEMSLHTNPNYRQLEAKVAELTALFANSRSTAFTLLQASDYVIERIRGYRTFYEMMKEGEIDKLELIDYVEECLDGMVENQRLAKQGKNLYTHV